MIKSEIVTTPMNQKQRNRLYKMYDNLKATDMNHPLLYAVEMLLADVTVEISILMLEEIVYGPRFAEAD